MKKLTILIGFLFIINVALATPVDPSVSDERRWSLQVPERPNDAEDGDPLRLRVPHDSRVSEPPSVRTVVTEHVSESNGRVVSEAEPRQRRPLLFARRKSAARTVTPPPQPDMTDIRPYTPLNQPVDESFDHRGWSMQVSDSARGDDGDPLRLRVTDSAPQQPPSNQDVPPQVSLPAVEESTGYSMRDIHPYTPLNRPVGGSFNHRGWSMQVTNRRLGDDGNPLRLNFPPIHDYGPPPVLSRETLIQYAPLLNQDMSEHRRWSMQVPNRPPSTSARQTGTSSNQHQSSRIASQTPRIPRKQRIFIQDGQCCVCFNEFSTVDAVLFGPCGHVLCTNCHDQVAKCPCCLSIKKTFDE